MLAPAGTDADTGRPVHDLGALDGADPSAADRTPTPAFWLYTSGTTGLPKGAMHRHGSIPVVCETYGAQVLGIRPDDRCLSAAKAFFAYGLGNSVLFPLVGRRGRRARAGTVAPGRRSPSGRSEYGATLFFAGPTFFANMLRAGLPGRRAGRRAAGRQRRGGRCPPPLPSAGRRTSASTSSTASA